jgi:Lar family restriction alleviation protein
MSDLKPCPFCGGEARAKAARIAEDAIETWVECGSCGARTEATEDAYSDHATAAMIWNTRSEADARMQRVAEALKPFAEFARAILHDENRKDDSVVVGKVIRDPAGDWGGRITFGNLRRAAEVYAALFQEGGGNSP